VANTLLEHLRSYYQAGKITSLVTIDTPSNVVSLVVYIQDDYKHLLAVITRNYFKTSKTKALQKSKETLKQDLAIFVARVFENVPSQYSIDMDTSLGLVSND